MLDYDFAETLALNATDLQDSFSAATNSWLEEHALSVCETSETTSYNDILSSMMTDITNDDYSEDLGSEFATESECTSLASSMSSRSSSMTNMDPMMSQDQKHFATSVVEATVSNLRSALANEISGLSMNHINPQTIFPQVDLFADIEILQRQQQQQQQQQVTNESKYNPSNSVLDMVNEQVEQLQHTPLNIAPYQKTSSIVDHTNIVMPRQSVFFTCDHPGCGKMFRKKSNYKSHYMTHTKEKHWSCHWCGRQFSRRHDLTRHCRVHTGERPYGCLFCGKRFSRQDARKRHLYKRHRLAAMKAAGQLQL